MARHPSPETLTTFRDKQQEESHLFVSLAALWPPPRVPRVRVLGSEYYCQIPASDIGFEHVDFPPEECAVLHLLYAL